MLLAADQRRCELDDRVTPVVGPAVEPSLEQRTGEEAAQQPFGLLSVEGLAGPLVLDELDAVEEASPADVTDDRQVQQLLQGPAEGGPFGLDVVVQAFGVEDVEVRHGYCGR